MFQKELYNFESLHKFIQDMYSVLNGHNVAKYSRVLPGIFTVQYDFHW
jgi:hypothetical protein